MNAKLKQKLSKLPVSPGVYFHLNSDGEVIYVGKAAVLKNRVRQYFQNSKKDPKTEALVSEIADTEWITVDTEMDALFLESEKIKQYMPKWNILLRDNKTVTYIKITVKDEVPYITFTRIPMDDGAEYIGPFYGKVALEKALRSLRRIFPYYTKPYTGRKTLDTDLGLTPGIEIGKCTPAEYKKNLRKLIRLMWGDRRGLIHDLEKTMEKASREGNYELAAEARDQLFGLNELKKKIVFSDKEFLDISSDQALADLQKLLGLSQPPRRIEGYDISHQSGTNAVGSMVVFVNGASARDKYRKFKLRGKGSDDLKSMVEVISRRLKHQEWGYPDLIILDGGITQVNAVLPLLEPLGIPVIGRDKSGDHSKSAEVKIVFNNKLIKLDKTSHIARLIARIDEEAHRFAITYHTLLKRKSMLK
ncbi:MAG: UvrB/UvrC motif-containing protein [Candidatus Saccharibacteria bacterium]|nr:UvrB/UvrC motif-containing protein [Candidatus Saccharibacteria bacterium]